MYAPLGKSGFLVAAGLLLTACGGGSGGGSGGGGATGDRLEIFEASSSGLLGVHPASPGSIIELDANADFSNVNSIPVLGATWNNGQTDDGHVQTVVYQNASDHIMKISTDASGGVTPTPERVSDNTAAICRFNIGQDFADVGNVRVAFMRCADDDWWWTVLRRDETGKIVDFPGVPLVDLIATGDGSHDGWLALDGGKIRHLDDQGVTTDVTGTPTGITEALHLESIQTGEVLLNIDGDLWVYEPGTGLTDLSYSFSNTTCFNGPANCPVLYVVDDSELFFIDNNGLHRTDMANDQVLELETNSQPPSVITGGRRLAVSPDRVVWSYEYDPNNSGFPDGDEETVISSLDKDGNNGIELHRGGTLDPLVSPQNQPFMDRAGDWFFYTLSDGVSTPTAVAVKMDNSASESFSGAAWVGVSTNLISFADLSQSLKQVYLADGLTDTSDFANKNVKSTPAASPGTLTNLGTLPADTETAGFMLPGGFGANRLATLTADDGSGGSQQDILFLSGGTAGSLQRVTDTAGEDETPSSFF